MAIETEAKPTALALFALFSRIGLLSFGGGLSGWLLREVVQQRRWMSEDEFLNGLSLSQALPGVNVTNVSVWIGYRLRGGLGAVAAVGGMVVPPAVLIILIATGLAHLSQYDVTHWALAGAAAAAIGLSLAMGVTAARRLPPGTFPIIVMVLVFLAVAILKWPLVWVVLVAGTVSITWAYRHA